MSKENANTTTQTIAYDGVCFKFFAQADGWVKRHAARHRPQHVSLKRPSGAAIAIAQAARGHGAFSIKLG
jgi:hypothetical protein